VIPVSLMLLDTPADEVWRLDAIPWNLEAFAELDDTTRRSDRARKNKGKGPAPSAAKGKNGGSSGDPPSDDSTPADKVALKLVFAQLAKSGSVPCPGCGKQIQDVDVSSGDSLQTAVLEFSPCGCTVPASDFM